MQLVADTNAIVAALLRKGETRNLLFSKQFEIFAPDRAKLEVLNHKQEFMEKLGLAENQFQNAVELVFENIAIIPIEEYFALKQDALFICPEGHKADWPFLALALKFKCALWSQDSGLKKQAKVKVFSTSELIKEFQF
ncbi:MAG: PIN domain-containing protein [Candidatus ainarchaeum sp.]|nr:PIN domain-containing protein [Candidatus ainarchaeum sp.]